MSNWKEVNDKLVATFQFSDFQQALAFLTKVGELAEALQHHPDIAIKNYSEVHIETTTHDAGNTITKKDRELTERIGTLRDKDKK